MAVNTQHFRTYLQPRTPVPGPPGPVGPEGPPGPMNTVAIVGGGTAVVNTTTPRSIFIGALHADDLIIPAGFIPVGSVIEIEQFGMATMPNSSSPTLTIEITGNGIVAGRAQFTVSQAMNNRSGPWNLLAFIYRDTPTTCVCTGYMRIGGDDANYPTTQASVQSVNANVDFSAQVALDIVAVWGAARSDASIQNNICMITYHTPRSLQLLNR